MYGIPVFTSDLESVRIERAQTGTYSVEYFNGSVITYYPPYGNAMGRLQDDIMYYQQILQRQEEQRRAMMLDDMERRGVQYATYTYFI